METPTSINANVGKRNGDEKVEGDEDEERIVSFSNDDGVVPWRPQRPHPTRIVEETPNNLKKDDQEIEDNNANTLTLIPANKDSYPQHYPSPAIIPQQKKQQIAPQRTPKPSIEIAIPLIDNNNS